MIRTEKGRKLCFKSPMCNKKMGKRNEWGFEEKNKIISDFQWIIHETSFIKSGGSKTTNMQYLLSFSYYSRMQRKKEHNQEEQNTVDRNCHRYLGYQSHIKMPSVTSFSCWIKMKHDRKSSRLIQSNQQIRIICSVTLIFELICFSERVKVPQPQKCHLYFKTQLACLD